MRRPDSAITADMSWRPRPDNDDEWNVWEDQGSENWWHVSAEHVGSGAVFAILEDGYAAETSPGIYAVFIGVREGRDLPADDGLDEMGKTALAVFSQYFHDSRLGRS